MAGVTPISHHSRPEAFASLEPYKAPSPIVSESPVHNFNPDHFETLVSNNEVHPMQESSAVLFDAKKHETRPHASEGSHAKPGIDHRSEMQSRGHELSVRNQEYQKYLELLREIKVMAPQASTEGTQVIRITVASEPSFDSVGTYDISHAQEIRDRIQGDVENSNSWNNLHHTKVSGGVFMAAHTSGNTSVTQSSEQSNYGNRQG